MPTSPGWGPVFGGRRAAAAVLAAADLVVVPFSLLVLLLDIVRWSWTTGRLIIQARAVSKSFQTHAVGELLFVPGRGRGRLVY